MSLQSKFLPCFLALLGFLLPSAALPASSTSVSNFPYTVIHQFPSGVSIENQVVRQCDGAILVTILTSPDVYLVSPDKTYDPVLVASFPQSLSNTGIVEMEQNIFYVATGNLTFSPPVLTFFSYSIWKVDLTKPDANGAGKLTKVADVPQVGFVNGMTVLNKQAGIILLADSWLRVVWSLNVKTGVVDLAINDTTMAAPGTADAINGIKVQGQKLFYTNQYKNTFNKIGINLNTGHATGSAVTLVSSTDLALDDFTFDAAGNAYVASRLGEIAFVRNAVSATGPVAVQAIEQSAFQTNFATPTSFQFGIRPIDLLRRSAYVTTNGVSGNATTPGASVSRIDFGSFV